MYPSYRTAIAFRFITLRETDRFYKFLYVYTNTYITYIIYIYTCLCIYKRVCLLQRYIIFTHEYRKSPANVRGISPRENSFDNYDTERRLTPALDLRTVAEFDDVGAIST